MSARRLLLISNSTMFGRGYLDHAVDEIRDLLGGNRRIVFVPFALSDRAAYTSRARKRLGQIGYQVMDAGDLVPGTDVVFDAFFVGGGNTLSSKAQLTRESLPETARHSSVVPLHAWTMS